ncbi:MAG: hypothetical protein AAF591_14530, partial [Verrucomicrobiota bacterium]
GGGGPGVGGYLVVLAAGAAGGGGGWVGGKGQSADAVAGGLMGFDFDLGRVYVDEGRFELAVTGLPKASGTIDFESARLHLKAGKLEMEEAHHVLLWDFEMTGEDGMLVRLPEVECVASIAGEVANGGEVRGVRLVSPEIVLSQADVLRLAEFSERWRGEGGDEAGAGPWELRAFSIVDGTIDLRGSWDLEEAAWPDVAMEIDVDLGGLRWGEGGLESDGGQEVAIRDLAVRAGGESSEAELVGVSTLEVAFDLDRVLGEGVVDRLRVSDVAVEFERESVVRLEPWVGLVLAGMEGSEADDRVAGDGGSERILRVDDLEVRGGQLYADGAGWDAALPRVEGVFELGVREAVGEGAYRLDIGDIRVSAALNEGERAFLVDGASVVVDVTARRVQEERAIDFVGVEGVRFEVGPVLTEVVDAVRGLVLGEEEEAVEEAVEEEREISVADPGERRWRIDALSLSRSEVLVEDLVPGLPVVSFQVQTDRPLENIYLDGQQTENEEISQRLELIGLRVVSPLNPLLTVADLRTIFVEFTLNGLLNQEIEVVEVLNPQVYVGQHLFWYVDHYRSLFKGEPETEETEEAGEVDVEIEEPEVAGVGIPGWNIKSLGVYNGKLVFAPKGYPVGENPFPFSVTSSLVDGEVDLELTIPKGDYVYPTLQLELVGLSGSVHFNLPARTVNNNLVETLSVEKMRFRKWEADNVFVTMTYDETGVYTQFGGDAYAGYINGAANVYIGEPYKWDGWVSGVDVDLEKFTGAFQPGWVSMTGVASGKFVVDGVEMVPGKATAEFTMDTPGELHIERMDTWLEDIPEEWSNLEQSIARIALEDFRDYSFDTGYGDLDAEGREGKLELFLDGPSGKRDFRVFFHDERGIAKQEEEALRVAAEAN